MADPVVLPGAVPSMDRVGELPGDGTPGALTLGDVGAAVPGVVVPGPAVAPLPRALPPLELAPPRAGALGHDGGYIRNKETEGKKRQ